MTVDFSNISNITSAQGLAYYTNNAVDGILFTGGMIAFFIIILIVLYRSAEVNGYDFGSMFTVASWSMFVISGFFWLAKLVPTLLVLMFLFFSAIGVIYLYSSRR